MLSLHACTARLPSVQVAAFDGSIWILGIVVKFEGRNKYLVEDLIQDADAERV
jgi:hypothetical protein